MEPNATSGRLDAVYPAQPIAVSHVRRDVAGVALAHGADEDALDHISLAVGEAAANVVVHAYRDRPVPGELRIVAERDNGFLDVLVRDAGMGMGPRTDSPGLGLGLALIGHAAVSCDITSPPRGGTELSMRFTLRSVGPAPPES